MPLHKIRVEQVNSRDGFERFARLPYQIYAKREGFDQWALTPSVFQHVGGKSSKGESTGLWGRKNTENIWNFSFEMFDEKKLEKEHFK